MKTFVLSLLTVAASASYPGVAPFGKHSYEYKKITPRYSPRTNPYAHGSFPSIDSQVPASYPQYPSYEKYTQKKEESSETVNPWAQPVEEEEEEVDKTGWYSPDMQYSPPKIRFVPNSVIPIFGICQVVSVGLVTATIQLAQLPGKATLYQVDLTASNPSTEI